jgi:hypothetical protein
MTRRFLVFAIALSLFMPSCNKKPQMEPELSLLDHLCEVELARHEDRSSESFVFINNRFMDTYESQRMDPEALVAIAQTQQDICAAAIFQLLGRYHADFIADQHDRLIHLLPEAAWRHLIFGLKTSKDPVDLALKLKVVSLPHPVSVRIQGIRWAGSDLTMSGCDALPPSFWSERDPSIVQEWLPYLSPSTCPHMVQWIKELMPIQDLGLHQNLLLTMGLHEFEERNSLILAYKQHPIEEIQKMAESLEVSLSQSPTLTMKTRISTTMPSDFGFTAAVEAGDFQKIHKALEDGANPNTPLAPFPSLLMFLVADGKAMFTPPPNASFHEYRAAKDQFDRKVLELIQVLLQKGANPNIKDRLGRSVLFHCINHQNNNLIPTLLNFGADPYMPNVSGVTPLGLAHMMENTQAIQLMKTWTEEKEQ